MTSLDLYDILEGIAPAVLVRMPGHKDTGSLGQDPTQLSEGPGLTRKADHGALAPQQKSLSKLLYVQ